MTLKYTSVLISCFFFLLLLRPGHSQDKEDLQKESASLVQTSVLEVSPVEDLMREHGVLSRLLLIYEELIHRLDKGITFSLPALQQSAGLVQKFIEKYHEKLEEEYIFVRFDTVASMKDLVATLRKQHEEGRYLTESILRQSQNMNIGEEENRRALQESMWQFIRMYRPHAAREDTVLFPAFKKTISAHEYNPLGDFFEQKEKEIIGIEGFQGVVADVSRIEKSLGIYSLREFTPTESH